MGIEYKFGLVFGFLLGIFAMVSYNYIYVIYHRIKTGGYK